MTQHTRSLAAALCLFLISLPASAQAPAPTKRTTARDARKTTTAADPLAAERRAQAAALITSLADEARGFKDETLRARVQAQAADTLWTTDPERAKTLFRRAWDAAEVADRDNQRQRDAERRAQTNGPRLATNLNRPDVRREVLRLAAKRDRALGEEFLAKLEEATRQENANLTTVAATGASGSTDAQPPQPQQRPQRRDPYATPPELARRLSLAMDFLNDGDTERALQFAEPALVKPFEMAVEFLVMLREKDPEGADQRYVAMLGRAAADADSDANTALLLSSYVLTPHMYMVVQPGGNISTSQRRRDIRPPSDMPAAVRQAFARAATAILLRPLPPADQDSTTSGRDGSYFVISRLLPFIEANAPERAADLHARLAALTPDVPGPERAELDQDLMRGLANAPERDPVQESLDRVSRAQTPEQRDLAYMQAAMAASFKGDGRARDFADKIENADLRQQVRAFVDFAAINQAITGKKDGAEVLRLAQTGELSHVQRTWALTEASRILLETDRPRAIEALEAAATEARRIDGEDADRARSLVAVATQYFKIDRNRAWELMADAVKAANAAPEFTGADAGLAARVQTQNNRSTINFNAPTLDLSGVFATLAQEDMNRAVELARSFAGEAPRATATLAIARAVLTEKRKS